MPTCFHICESAGCNCYKYLDFTVGEIYIGLPIDIVISKKEKDISFPRNIKCCKSSIEVPLNNSDMLTRCSIKCSLKCFCEDFIVKIAFTWLGAV